jgi:hypothetical protein
MSSIHYSVLRDTDMAYGTVFISVRSAKVNLELHLEAGDMEAASFEFDDWQEELRKQDILITPMIWRQGACVENKTAEGGREIACIVPPPAEEDQPAPTSNFSASDCMYSILYREGLPSRKLHFLKVLERLIPVGTEVYVLLKSPTVVELNLQISRTDRSREYLAGRLNVPTVEKPEPGKIYVTCIQKPILARSDASDVSCVTLVLDPWDAVLDLPDGVLCVPNLITGAG